MGTPGFCTTLCQGHCPPSISATFFNFPLYLCCHFLDGISGFTYLSLFHEWSSFGNLWGRHSTSRRPTYRYPSWDFLWWWSTYCIPVDTIVAVHTSMAVACMFSVQWKDESCIGWFGWFHKETYHYCSCPIQERQKMENMERAVSSILRFQVGKVSPFNLYHPWSRWTCWPHGFWRWLWYDDVSNAP